MLRLISTRQFPPPLIPLCAPLSVAIFQQTPHDPLFSLKKCSHIWIAPNFPKESPFSIRMFYFLSLFLFMTINCIQCNVACSYLIPFSSNEDWNVSRRNYTSHLGQKLNFDPMWLWNRRAYRKLNFTLNPVTSPHYFNTYYFSYESHYFSNGAHIRDSKKIVLWLSKGRS